MTTLVGKTALITGSATGIGLAVAQRFALEGARVIIADRDASAAERAARTIGEHARAEAMDIAAEESVAAAYTRLSASGWTPNVVVANAGVQLFGQDAPIAELELDIWQHTLSVNLTGTFLTVKYAVRAMLAEGGGSIIVTGSPTGINGEGKDFTAYSTTKAGIHGLTRTVAAAYAKHAIRVNAVIPAYTETSLVNAIVTDPGARAAIIGRIPMGRPGTGEDVAGIMVYLAGDDSAFATGGLFHVDGGMTTI
ncbi:SDR family NAD(P)-dependent oxidoreductase [Leifsonia aquatica]|uniref:SDR family NAD(P)-dependent oxidoreductase n=1 Tax=Leifsonia aquatica TaxID=144185 RepID=UPI00046954F2|nr:SDR family NAD(P)-dependent oxidoreductase [Leifsonia aquatica]